MAHTVRRFALVKGYSQVRALVELLWNTIAAELHVTVDTVRTWRGRFADHGLETLVDRHRSGRPPRFTPVQVAQVKSLACQLPAQTGAPFRRRASCADATLAATCLEISAAH